MVTMKVRQQTRASESQEWKHMLSTDGVLPFYLLTADGILYAVLEPVRVQL